MKHIISCMSAVSMIVQMLRKVAVQMVSALMKNARLVALTANAQKIWSAAKPKKVIRFPMIRTVLRQQFIPVAKNQIIKLFSNEAYSDFTVILTWFNV
ncbi:MAG: hypothetical protein ICV66_11205 [Chitinophagaceae bacterium]|nr:hypothetical protein [Chitinophagaceae bacterium]